MGTVLFDPSAWIHPRSFVCIYVSYKKTSPIGDIHMEEIKMRKIINAFKRFKKFMENGLNEAAKMDIYCGCVQPGNTLFYAF